MTITFEYKKFENYLLVEATGIYDLNDAAGQMPLVFSACRLTGLVKVIIDFRHMDGIPEASEKIIYALGAREHYADYLEAGGPALKIAYLGAAPAVSSYEPGLEIIRQQGLPFELFACEKDACRWLGVNAPNF